MLDRLFRRRARELASVDGPTRVELDCRVASPDVVQSQVTSVVAALIRWSLLEERTVHASRGGGAERSYRVLARGLYGDAPLILSFEGTAIEVPVEAAQWVLVEDPQDGDLLARVPPALRPVAASLQTDRAVAYREAYLRQGDPVRLTATLERVRVESGGGYRAAPAAGRAFRALPEDRLVVRETGYGIE